MYILEYNIPQATDHVSERKKERLDNLLDVILPSDFYQNNENKQEINKILLDSIKTVVNKRINDFIHNMSDTDHASYHASVVAQVQIVRNDKIYTPVLKAISETKQGDTKSNEGNTYVTISKSNTLYTLLLLTNPDPASLAKQVVNHAQQQKNDNISSEDVVVRTMPNALIKINADYVIKRSKEPQVVPTAITSPDQLLYKVRGDYRNSSADPSFFEHKKYGKGKIIASEKGMASSGIWDSITVQFPGQPKPIIFKNLYTKSFFLAHPQVKAEAYIRLLSALTGKKVVLI